MIKPSFLFNTISITQQFQQLNPELEKFITIFKNKFSEKIITDDFKQKFLCALINPEQIDNLGLKELQYLNLTKSQLNEICLVTSNYNYANPQKQIRALLIEHSLRILLDLKYKPISEHNIADIFLPIIIKQINPNTDKLQLVIEKRFFSLLDKLKTLGLKLKPTKEIANKIAFFTNVNLPKANIAPWIADQRRQARNWYGTCALFTYKNINLALTKQAHEDPTLIHSLKNEKYSYASIAGNVFNKAQKEKLNYFAKVQAEIEYMRMKYCYLNTYIEALDVSQFSMIIKNLIHQKMKAPKKLFINLMTPSETKTIGHSTFLSIQQKSIATINYYSLDFHDSNYGILVSQEQNLLIPESALTDHEYIINCPLNKCYGDLAIIMLYEEVNKSEANHAIKPQIAKTKISFQLIMTNPFILAYCDMSQRLEYLAYIIQNKLFYLLNQQDKQGWPLAMHIADKATLYIKRMLLQIAEDYPELLNLQHDGYYLSLALFSPDNDVKEIFLTQIMRNPMLAEHCDKMGNTLLIHIASNSDNHIKEIILKLIPPENITLLRQTNKQQQSLAIFLAKNANNKIKSELKKRIANNLPLLKQTDQTGRTLADYLRQDNFATI